jgi:hypothetical protein
MKIPRKIYDVLNNKKNFDFIFLEMLKTKTSEDAYDAAIDLMREYAPKFKHYKDFDSYRVILSTNSNKEMEVPKEVIQAVTEGIDKLFHKHLLRLKVRKMAYDATVKEINMYLPDYKPHRNYQSFKALQSIKHKKKRKK